MLPSGLMEQLTAPGRNIGAGIASIGQGIAESLKRYQQNKAEFDLARGETEGLIAQYIKKADPLPTGEVGGFDVQSLANIVGEKNVKKFVEGKASTADMLAMSHSIKTAQAERDKAMEREATSLQIDALKRKQVADVEALNQANSTRDAIKFALTDQNKPDFNNLGQVGSNSVGVSPVPYEEARTNLAKYLAATNAAPETFSAIDQILSIAGKKQPMQVGVQPLPGNLGSVVTAGGKTEIIKPDASLQARVIPGYQGTVPTEKEAIDFRQLQADTMASKGLIDELLQLAKTPGASIEPQKRARGQALSQQLVGKLRTAVLGPGTINESERQIIESLAANPATIFSMNANTEASLNTLKATLDKSIADKAKSLGLTGAQSTQNQGVKRYQMTPAGVIK